jgi:hypothetical protein
MAAKAFNDAGAFSIYAGASDHLKRGNTIFIGCYNYPVNSGIANSAFWVINNTFKRFLIIRVKSKPEIGYQVFDLFTLIER